LAALIIGLGTIVAQLTMSGDADGDAGGAAGGHDVSVDGDAGADGHDFGMHADGDGAVHHDAGGGGGFLPIILSFRFWTFGLLAFGMVGSILHFAALAPAAFVPFIALVVGLGSGGFASFSFRALARASTQSGTLTDDAVGHIGRVLIAPGKQRCGKVRVELSGQTVDYLATTDDEQLDVGDRVLVVEMRDDTAHVARPPAEFLGGTRDED
jgi:membrane protein implicated in regulation of membrane protease activity